MKADWQQIEDEIVRRLDVKSEAESLGIDFSKTQPSADGWLECYAHKVFREEMTPSAAINIGDNGKRGVYTDLGGGGEKSIGWFDFAAKAKPFPDRKSARAFYAAKTGVVLPGTPTKKKGKFTPADQLLLHRDKTEEWVREWASNKEGVDPEAVIASGACAAEWPKGKPIHRVIAVPGYNPSNLKEMTAVAIYRVDGKLFEKHGDLRERKVHNLGGSVDSLVRVRDPIAATRIDVMEGLPDAFCFSTLLPEHVATVTNTSGAKGFHEKFAHLFDGKDEANIQGHADEDGRARQLRLAAMAHGRAKIVRIVPPPPDGDWRDWKRKGGTAEQYEAIVAASPLFNPEDPEVKRKLVEIRPITNIRTFYEDGKAKSEALPMCVVLSHIFSRCEKWPKRCGSLLFIDDPKHGVALLEKVGSLFGWLAHETGPIDWHAIDGAVSKEEVFFELCRTAPAVKAIETFPHFPSLPDHYYSAKTPPLGDGTAVDKLLDRFNPASEIDRDLFLAALATPMWGGAGGMRPAFDITSDDGRGAGKPAAAQMICEVYGGAMSFSMSEKIETIKQRLLSPAAISCRTAMLDNLKAAKISCGDLEALITAPTISGKKMYTGEASRPNMLTWFLTVNGPAMSTDMAQRCVTIKIKRSTCQGTWYTDTLEFIRSHRDAILGDLLAFLQSEARPLARYTRWAAWESAVLARLPDPEEAQKVIEERQKAVDVDDEEAVVIEDFFENELASLDYVTDLATVHIPNKVATAWVNRATNELRKTTAVTRLVKQLHGEKKFKCLGVDPSRSAGRGMRWVGVHASPTAGPYLDLERRITDKLLKQRQMENLAPQERTESW